MTGKFLNLYTVYDSQVWKLQIRLPRSRFFSVFQIKTLYKLIWRIFKCLNYEHTFSHYFHFRNLRRLETCNQKKTNWSSRRLKYSRGFSAKFFKKVKTISKPKCSDTYVNKRPHSVEKVYNMCSKIFNNLGSYLYIWFWYYRKE